jgi:aminoglycoside 6-adenylyltransferase
MRSEEEVMALILNVANADDRIRAVLLNGSRTNPKSTKDIFQDFDIAYIVSEINTFLNDHTWIDIFGERIILQMPDEMTIGDKDENAFHYLMLFKDGNRIDLTIFPVEKLKNEFKQDSLTLLLLDKDHYFEKLLPPGEKNYLIKRPDEKEFTDCCNEFWWVSTYVVKGLWRNEITYTKDKFEGPVRSMFMKMIEWHIGTLTEFSVSFGQAGKNIKKYLSPSVYDKILSTYPDSNSDNIWNSLFIMTEVFSDFANQVAKAMRFNYNKDEEQKVMEYLNQIHTMTKEK